ncbi:hypothetical protein [Actinocorallia longicatena]|uniref:Protein kinase domain-containing protein n=1 Tax=Actinocorallia longicatena TaxID=111803 RepID=A0ABP6Q6R6_9ACTN
MLEPGNRVGHRYRLDQELDSTGETTLWRATDEVLARTVALRVFAVGPDRQEAVLAAACAAGRLRDARFEHVFDIGRSAGGVYVVTEWPRGESLASLLAAGRLSPDQAIWLIGETARALAAAHSKGLAHRLLSPRSLYWTPTGGVKLLGLGTQAALAGHGSGDPERSDLRGLGLLLWSALVGGEVRWPGEPVVLPIEGPLGRELEFLVRQAVYAEPEIRDLGRFADLLDVLRPRPVRPPKIVTGVARSIGWPRRAGRIALTSGTLVASVTSLLFVLPRDEPPEDLFKNEAVAPRPPARSAPAQRKPSRLHPKTARTFDPFGDGGGSAGLGGGSRITFHTQRYTTAEFGNLKPGTGVLLDMGAPVTLSTVRLRLGGWRGARIELRLGDRPDLDDLRTLTAVRPSGTLADLRPAASSPRRYILIWFTRLPASDPGTFRADLRSLTLYGSRREPPPN